MFTFPVFKPFFLKKKKSYESYQRLGDLAEKDLIDILLEFLKIDFEIPIFSGTFSKTLQNLKYLLNFFSKKSKKAQSILDISCAPGLHVVNEEDLSPWFATGQCMILFVSFKLIFHVFSFIYY